MQSKSAVNKIINETPDFEKMVNRIEVETLGNFLMNYSSDLSYIKAFQNWKTNGFKDFSYFEQEEYSLKNFLIEYKLLRFIRKEKHYELFLKISEYFIQQKEIDVVKFAKCLSERNEISMASKILFLHSPKKIIIYDKYAKIGIDFNGNSYEQFVSKVKSNSLKCNEIIIKLSKQIPKSVCVIEKEILNIDCSEIRLNRLIDKLFWTFGKVIDNQKKNMKKSLLLIALFFSLITNAQEDKSVILTVSGTGKTIEEAKTNALRSAIEQAFGAFISSKTEILNDNLVKDEIVSVANGNIQKFDIITQVEIPNNGYAMTLNATVSISKLTSFAQSKGISVEVKGGLFAANIIQQELNEKAELISLQNILNTSNEILKKSFNYSIETVGSPTFKEGKYDIPLKILIKLNKNFYQFRHYLINSLSGLSMSESEVANYDELKKPIGQLIIRRDTIGYYEFIQKRSYSENEKANKILNRKEFDEKSEKILYFYNNQVLEIDTKNKLDEFYKNNFNNYLVEIIPSLSIARKNDLGYLKIFFRNESSINLLDKFLKSIAGSIYDFELSNNIDSIIEKKKLRWTSFNDNFKIVLTHDFNKYAYPTKLKGTIENGSNFLNINEIGDDEIRKKIQQDEFFKNTLTGEISDYFPNLLSIFPLKQVKNNMLLSFSKYTENDTITTFDCIDTKSIEEIKQLKEYKIRAK